MSRYFAVENGPGKAHFGYKNIPKDGKNSKCNIAVSEYEASIVKLVYGWYSTGAFSMESIRHKIKAEYGLTWSYGVVDDILKNPFYHGFMVCKGVQYPHRYETIIPKSLFDQVQAQKAIHRKAPFKFVAQPYLYRGLMKCAECGLAITAEKHKGHVYYHCTEYNGKHGAAWLREELLTEQFEQFFKRLQMPEKIREKILVALNKVHEQKIVFHNSHQKELSKEHDVLTTMIDNLYMDKLKGKIAEADYDRFYQKFRIQLDDVSSRMAQLQNAEDNYYHTVKYILEITSKAQEIFESSKVDEKRQLIKLLLQNLRLGGKNIVYDVQKPFDMILKAGDGLLWCAREESNL